MIALRAASSQPLFYCAALAADGDIVLTGGEANHVKAQRLQPGDAVALFDGHGSVARGNIRTIARREIRIAIAATECEPPPLPRLELHCAVPKGERISVLLDMATQLGMSRFIPIRWQRGVVDPGARAKERWQRICIEACKQSRRLYVPEIAAPAALEDAAAQARRAGALVIAAHPQSGTSPLGIAKIAEANRIALFVGPEGGLTDDEVEVLENADGHLISLGNAILRIEAAAISLIVAVNTAREIGQSVS